ncbi:MAG: hypothetical protein J6V40_04280, partial [Clostridia bacterium]|nr:hypothetical protein [Clostridia bacterium]
SDDFKYGGNGLVHHITYHSKKFNGQNYIELYLPARTAIVLKEKPRNIVKEDKVNKETTKTTKKTTKKK